MRYLLLIFFFTALFSGSTSYLMAQDSLHLWVSRNIERFTTKVDPETGRTQVFLRGKEVHRKEFVDSPSSIDDFATALYFEYRSQGYVLQGRGLGWIPELRDLALKLEHAALFLYPCTIDEQGTLTYNLDARSAELSYLVASPIAMMGMPMQGQFKPGIVDAISLNADTGHLFMQFSADIIECTFMHTIDLNFNPPRLQISPCANQKIAR